MNQRTIMEKVLKKYINLNGFYRLKFLIKSCAQAESLSNLQTSEITYSDQTEILINNNDATEAIESENEIEYLESEFDITQFNLCNTQVRVY